MRPRVLKPALSSAMLVAFALPIILTTGCAAGGPPPKPDAPTGSSDAMTTAASAGNKPVVFNHVSGQRTAFDEAVREHFGDVYKVVDFTDHEYTYAGPRPSSGFGPTQPVYVNNRCVAGSVWVVYVITAEGAVTSAYALKSTDTSLEMVAVQRMEERRFQPAQLDGKPVSLFARTPFNFPCPK